MMIRRNVIDGSTMIKRIPSVALRPFLKQLWLSHSADEGGIIREHVLPTGDMHLVFRLTGKPLRIFRDPSDVEGETVGEPVVGGVRSAYYVKEVGTPVTSVGVQFRPGVAQWLFGASASELAERHTPLSALWGSHANDALEQLHDARTDSLQLATLERLLLLRLPRMRGLHPAVAQALSELDQSPRIEWIVRNSQYSHRGFIALFKHATGLSPKRYARLMRFQRALSAVGALQPASLGDLALVAGYSDQAHMNREFREFAGVTPLQYRRLSPAFAHHVAIQTC